MYNRAAPRYNYSHIVSAFSCRYCTMTDSAPAIDPLDEIPSSERQLEDLQILLGVARGMAAHRELDELLGLIVESARKSIVVVSFAGRDGRRQGLGTGFVVGADGLIATNLHVLGEARPISVETADGKRHAVSLYLDATAEWAVNRPEQPVTWARERRRTSMNGKLPAREVEQR